MVWPSYLVGREALITPLWARILRASIAVANDDSLDSRVATEARHILQTVRQTHYQHHTYIDPATGTYDCDCSEFVGYILEQIAPANYALIPKEERFRRGIRSSRRLLTAVYAPSPRIQILRILPLVAR